MKMADLREALGAIGLARVQTYIQSGNILFESEEDEAHLRQRIEQQIEKVFGLSIKSVLRTSTELKRIGASCPFTEKQIADAEATSEGECLYVTILADEPQAERIDKLKEFDSKDDQFQIVGRDVFLLYGKSARNSKLAIQVEKLGVLATTRNWKTINKLISLCEEMEAKIT